MTTTTTSLSTPISSSSYYHKSRSTLFRSSSSSSSSSNLSLTQSYPFTSISLSSNRPLGPTHIPASSQAKQQQKRNQKRRRPPPPPKKNTNSNSSSNSRNNSRGLGQSSQSVLSSNSSINSRNVAESEPNSVVVVEEKEEEVEWWMEEEKEEGSGNRSPPPMPKPPAGFVFADDGRVVMASKKRIVTIVDEANNQPLDCIIRRVFQSTQGDECMLLFPADMPVQILRTENFSGWMEIDDDEVEAIFHASYALAKNRMHLVDSGFCYTVRGGYCYSDDQILRFRPDEDEDADAEESRSEGVEIASFSMDGRQYMIYTPVAPLLFVAVKDKNGVFRVADDDRLDDPAVVAAINEETEFTALVEEEKALRHSVLGER